MSTDFAERTFPVFADPSIEKAGEAASRRGYAAGFAAGARAAQEDAERLREEMRAEHARAMSEVSRNASAALAVLQAAAQKLTEHTVPVVTEAQATMAAVAMDLADSVVGYYMADRTQAAEAALARAMRSPEGARAIVRLNPEDVAALEAIDAIPDGVQVVPDGSVGRGDAMAELEHGFLDARLSTALSRARQALLDESEA